MKSITESVWETALLSGNHLVLLLAVAKGVDANGGVWEGYISDLAREARCSLVQAYRILDILEGNGFVRTERGQSFAKVWVTDPARWIVGEQAR
jgi:DNA-binding MarR family transcriptional regulator